MLLGELLELPQSQELYLSLLQWQIRKEEVVLITIFSPRRDKEGRETERGQNREDTVVYLEHHWLKLDLMFHSRLKAVEESKG